MHDAPLPQPVSPDATAEQLAEQIIACLSNAKHPRSALLNFAGDSAKATQVERLLPKEFGSEIYSYPPNCVLQAYSYPLEGAKVLDFCARTTAQVAVPQPVRRWQPKAIKRSPHSHNLTARQREEAFEYLALALHHAEETGKAVGFAHIRDSIKANKIVAYLRSEEEIVALAYEARCVSRLYAVRPEMLQDGPPDIRHMLPVDVQMVSPFNWPQPEEDPQR